MENYEILNSITVLGSVITPLSNAEEEAAVKVVSEKIVELTGKLKL